MKRSKVLVYMDEHSANLARKYVPLFGKAISRKCWLNVGIGSPFMKVPRDKVMAMSHRPVGLLIGDLKQ